jgi:hypothetical protein
MKNLSFKRIRINDLDFIEGDWEESFYQIFINNPNIGPPGTYLLVLYLYQP